MYYMYMYVRKCAYVRIYLVQEGGGRWARLYPYSEHGNSFGNLGGVYNTHEMYMYVHARTHTHAYMYTIHVYVDLKKP